MVATAWALFLAIDAPAQPPPAQPEPPASCELTPTPTAADALLLIAIHATDQCFTLQRASSDLAHRVKQELDEAAGEMGDQRRVHIQAALTLVRNDAQTHEESVATDWKSLYGVMLNELANEQRLVATTGGRPEYWKVANHRTFQSAADQTFALNYRPVVEACNSPQTCTAAAGEAASLNTYLGLTEQILEYDARPRVAAFAARLAERKAQWDYYFDKARSQYWWELAINSKRYKASDGELAAPPGDQLIIAHPSLAFEYVGGGAQNESAYSPVLMVELVGYNKFGWNGVQPRKHPLGASLVATYTPDNTGDRTGFGVLFHVNNNWSIGATRRDTGSGMETTWLVSADLMKAILKKTSSAREKMMCANGNDCQGATNP